MSQSASILAWILHCLGALAAIDQPVDGGELVAIRNALSAHRDGIYSLEASYEVTAYEGPPVDGHRGNVAFVSDWKWLQRGQRMLLETTRRKVSGELVKHVLLSFDGSSSWRVGYDLGGIAAKQVSWKSDRLTRPWDEMVTLADFTGWKVVGLHQSIVDLLNDKSINDGEYVDAVGQNCFRIILHRWSFTEGGPAHVLVVWFDPEHGWLPRQIQVMPEAAWLSICNHTNAPEFEIGFQFHHFAIDEFREVTAIGDTHRYWFPVKAMSNGGGMSELRFDVHAISINPDIAVSLFVPDVPPGSALYENFGTTEQRILEPIETGPDIVPVPDSAFASSSRPISATPPKGFIFRYLVLPFSLLLLVIAVVLKLRSFSSRS